MAELDKGKIKKLRLGELIGNAATVFCGVVLAFFIVGFTVAQTQELETLRLVTLILSPCLLAAGIAVSAYCSVRFGGAIEKLVNKYVIDTFIENAALLHPERNNLSFYVEVDLTAVYVKVNGYKEAVTFDFSAFKKLSFSKKLLAINAVENRLICTFCRLYERGAEYAQVNYCERNGRRRKTGKIIPIIKDGVPDNKAFKTYLKLK